MQTFPRQKIESRMQYKGPHCLCCRALPIPAAGHCIWRSHLLCMEAFGFRPYWCTVSFYRCFLVLSCWCCFISLGSGLQGCICDTAMSVVLQWRKGRSQAGHSTVHHYQCAAQASCSQKDSLGWPQRLHLETELSKIQPQIFS